MRGYQYQTVVEGNKLDMIYREGPANSITEIQFSYGLINFDVVSKPGEGWSVKSSSGLGKLEEEAFDILRYRSAIENVVQNDPNLSQSLIPEHIEVIFNALEKKQQKRARKTRHNKV